MLVTRRRAASLVLAAATLNAGTFRSVAEVDPEQMAASYPNLLHVGIENFAVRKPTCRVGVAVEYSFDLDVSDLTDDVERGIILCYIDDGVKVEARRIIPITASISMASNTYSTRGPSPITRGSKILVLLSSNTYSSRPFEAV
jgi:hypothetical protein